MALCLKSLHDADGSLYNNSNNKKMKGKVNKLVINRKETYDFTT